MTDASKYYELQDGKLNRNHRSCPKCGAGFFLAEHYDRWVCGKCAYTVFKRKGKKAPQKGPKGRSPRKRVKSM